MRGVELMVERIRGRPAAAGRALRRLVPRALPSTTRADAVRDAMGAAARARASSSRRRARSGSAPSELGRGQGQRPDPQHRHADLLRLRHRLPLRQVHHARLRPRHRHLGRRPPGPRLAREGGGAGARRRPGAAGRSCIYQLVSLRRGDETGAACRSAPANIVTLREVIDEVGADACRFFFLAALGRRADGVRPRAGEAADRRRTRSTTCSTRTRASPAS